MESPDSFYTIATDSEVEIKVKGSRFVARTAACTSKIEAEEILDNIRKKYHDATHHCFAYRVGMGRESTFRYSDAGEPSGTAGKPIFDRIEGKHLTNVIVVVTRYFGGTKLGTGGLTRAYSEAAAGVLEKAGVVKKYITKKISLTVPFPDYNSVERIIQQYKAAIVRQEFADVVELTVEVRISTAEQFINRLVELTSGRISIE
jgi:uncharacterized YigZ family protein